MYNDFLKEAETNTDFPFFSYSSNTKKYINSHKNPPHTDGSNSLNYFIDHNIYAHTGKIYIKYFKTSLLRPKATDLIVINDPSGVYETQYLDFDIHFSRNTHLNPICTSNFFSKKNEIYIDTVKMVKRH
jgi:hypothetical protein